MSFRLIFSIMLFLFLLLISLKFFSEVTAFDVNRKEEIVPEDIIEPLLTVDNYFFIAVDLHFGYYESYFYLHKNTITDKEFVAIINKKIDDNELLIEDGNIIDRLSGETVLVYTDYMWLNKDDNHFSYDGLVDKSIEVPYQTALFIIEYLYNYSTQPIKIVTEDLLIYSSKYYKETKTSDSIKHIHRYSDKWLTIGLFKFIY